jgi:cellobiose dehydrogenase (acceptor)
MPVSPDQNTDTGQRCTSHNKNESGGGWCGISHGTTGQMTNALLLVAWPEGDQVQTSFRSTPSWMMPPLYQGSAKLTQISSYVNDTMYEVIYRCQNCFSWENGDIAVNVSTKSGQLVLGRAQAVDAPQAPKCPSKILAGFHDFGYGQYGADIKGAQHSSYSAWAAMATKTPTTDCENVPAYTTKATPT